MGQPTSHGTPTIHDQPHYPLSRPTNFGRAHKDTPESFPGLELMIRWICKDTPHEDSMETATSHIGWGEKSSGGHKARPYAFAGNPTHGVGR